MREVGACVGENGKIEKKTKGKRDPQSQTVRVVVVASTHVLPLTLLVPMPSLGETLGSGVSGVGEK